MLNIKKGGHRDLERYFTLIEMDFDSEELLPKIAIHKGMMNGALELLIAYDEDSGMDAGYALVATKNLYGYVLLKYLAVMPWCRGQGLGIQIMRLINKRYADKQGIIAELTEFEDPDPDRLRKLRKFFNRFGYEEIESNYTISGVKANLLVKQIKGKTDITPVAQRIIPDFYSRFLTVFTMEKMLDIKPVK